MHKTSLSLARYWILWLLTLSTGAADELLTIDPQQLYGSWMAVEQVPDEGSVETRFAINRDATFSGTLAVNGVQVWSYSGTWSLQGNRITWHYTASSLALLAEDRAEVDELLAVDGTVLRYRSGRRGSTHTLHRVE